MNNLNPLKLKDPLLLKQQAVFNNEWVSSLTNETFEVFNPYNKEVLVSVPDMNGEDTQLAISYARTALDSWSNQTAGHRGDLLLKWHDLILEHEADLARIITLEGGKPIREALGEVRYGASFIQWFAEEGKRIYGDVIPAHAKDKRIIVIKQAIGVVAAITPWNFPIAMITRKVGAALAAGCTIVVKPSELTPLSALAIAELAIRAGIPPGVFNVITGNHPAEIGKAICEDPSVTKVSFTGSTEVGKLLLKQSADTVKKISLELGGNAPFIVFDDADLEAATSGLIASKFRNAGQTCICANRILLQDKIHDEFIERFKLALTKETVGNGMDEHCTIGPLINESALHKVEQVVEEATMAGAKIVIGGNRHPLGSTFYSPTILTDVSSTMEIANTEIFGPVAAVFKFSSEQEAIDIANNTTYGLAAYFYGKDISRVWRVAERLEYGMVGINTGMISTAIAPFGGIKQSGLGREGSKYGIEEYLEVKYLCFHIEP
jgi:succinate-semialdehyde dehydrogenase/glutarate-semialdehyde dehydrogenase